MDGGLAVGAPCGSPHFLPNERLPCTSTLDGWMFFTYAAQSSCVRAVYYPLPIHTVEHGHRGMRPKCFLPFSGLALKFLVQFVHNKSVSVPRLCRKALGVRCSPKVALQCRNVRIRNRHVRHGTKKGLPLTAVERNPPALRTAKNDPGPRSLHHRLLRLGMGGVSSICQTLLAVGGSTLYHVVPLPVHMQVYTPTWMGSGWA